MQNILIVVDMQNDFINGTLGTKEAEAIVSKVEQKISGFSGRIIYTRDTHEENYLDTQEGKKLPVKHCIRNTKGWELSPQLDRFEKEWIIDKPTFGSRALAEELEAIAAKEEIEVTLVGLCTDICVVSNALLIKAYLPEIQVKVIASCCAGVTPASHEAALTTMQMCQIKIENN